MIGWINLTDVKISVYGESDEVLVEEVVFELLFRILFGILNLLVRFSRIYLLYIESIK